MTETSRDARGAAPVYPRDYNYEHFSFAEEDAEVAYWSATAPALGRTAPATAATRLDGSPWLLAEELGRPVVLEFGSYTCPIFCGHVSAMEKLAAEFPEAAFIAIYAREAHPGDITRAHAAIEDCHRLARLTMQREGIGRTVLVDSLDGVAHLLWGGGYNPVFVLDPQGHVVVRRFWNEPSDVRTALTMLREGLRPVPVESSRFGAAAERGPLGSEMLARGGPEAVRDFATGAPPRIIRGLSRSTAEVQAVLRSVVGVELE